MQCDDVIVQRQQFLAMQLTQHPIEMDVGNAKGVRQIFLRQWAFILVWCRVSDLIETVADLDKEVDGTLKRSTRSYVDEVLRYDHSVT